MSHILLHEALDYKISYRNAEKTVPEMLGQYIRMPVNHTYSVFFIIGLVNKENT